MFKPVIAALPTDLPIIAGGLHPGHVGKGHCHVTTR